MNGQQVKNKIAGTGHNITEVAELIGIPRTNLSQSLSSQDVKTGLIEKISVALGVPVSYFFDNTLEHTSKAVASGDFSAASIHGNASVEADGEAVLKERVKSLEQLVQEKDRMIEEKERTIKILMEK